MKIFYRISDNSYVKQKMPGANKEVCLLNFLKVFKDVIFTPDALSGKAVPAMAIIADRCNEETLKIVKDTGLPVTETDLGNAESMHCALDMAVEQCRDDELAYFVEDDYLHLGNAPTLLREGMMHSDYITLYDHPDKYTNMYGMGEVSKVVRTSSSHWRYTISTCMTFAAKVGVLKEDIDVFKKHRASFEGEHLTQNENGEHPIDHSIFKELKEEKNRKLTVCIPGAACHTDLTFSGVAGHLLIEPWAIQTMINELEVSLANAEKRLKDEDKQRFAELKSVTLQGEGWEYLVGLHALLSLCE